MCIASDKKGKCLGHSDTIVSTCKDLLKTLSHSDAHSGNRAHAKSTFNPKALLGQSGQIPGWPIYETFPWLEFPSVFCATPEIALVNGEHLPNYCSNTRSMEAFITLLPIWYPNEDISAYIKRLVFFLRLAQMYRAKERSWRTWLFVYQIHKA